MAAQTLTDDQITARLQQLSGWERDGDQITRTYTFDSYLAGLAFATAAGVIADGRDHHPDMTIGYRQVTLSFTTHDADSRLTTKDFDTAAAIEGIEYRGKR